jgi:hypothetical protein
VDSELIGKTPSPRRARRSSSPQEPGSRGLIGMSPKRDVFSIDEKWVDHGSVGTRMGVDASDIDLEVQLDIARKNSVSVATSAYPTSHSVGVSMSGKMMQYQGRYSPHLSQIHD